MNEHDQLREQMWDLVYGLATPAESAALRARITSDPKVARLYAEVHLEADLIAQAAKVDDASVTLPEVEPRREKPAAAKAKEAAEPARGLRLSQSLHWLAAVAASALAVLLTVGTFWKTEIAQRNDEDLVFISVRQYQADTLVASVPTELQLEAKDALGQPAAAKLRAQVADSRGNTLYETVVETDKEGKARFHVPGQAVAQDVNLRVLRDVVAKLELPTQTGPSPSLAAPEAEQAVELQKREQVVLDELLPVQPEPIQAGATFDKDWYEPGEEVQFRAAPVTAFSRQPQDPSSLAFRLQGPDGRQWAPAEAATVEAAGVVSGKFQLPADAPPGQYALTVLGRAPDLLGDEAEIIVAGDLAEWKENLFARGSLDGTARLKRSLGSVSGLGGGGFGEAVRGGVTAAGAAPGGAGGKSDESREHRRDLAMNQAASRAAKSPATAGTAGARSDPAPSGGPAAAPPAPSPRPLEGADPLPDADKLAQADRPDAQRFFGQMEKARDESRPGTDLEVVVPPEFAGKPVEIEAFYKNRIRLGKTVSNPTQTAANEKFAEPAPDGPRARIAAVPLAQWVDGEEVEVEFRELSPTSPPLRIRKLVRVPSALEIELAEAKETYAPGETVRLLVEVKNTLDGSAVPNAAFCLAVKPALVELRDLQQLSKAIDDRVSLLDEKQAQGLRGRSVTQREGEDRTADLSAKPMPKLAAKEDAKKSEAGKDQAGAADAPTAEGLVLPAPAPAADAAVTESAAAPADLPQLGATLMDADGGAAPYSDNADFAVDSLAQSARPVLISNEAAVRKSLEKAQAERSAQEATWALWRARLGRLLLVGGVVMLLALGVAFAMQRPAKALVWIPSLAIAAASFAVGVVWLLNQPHPPGREMARALRDDAGGSVNAPEKYERLRNPATATPPESGAAIVTDSEGSVTGQRPGSGAPAPAEFDSAADGAEPGIAGDLRQRRALDRQSAQRPAEESDLAQRGGERSELPSAGREARDKRPLAPSSAPAEPNAAKNAPATRAVKESAAGVKAKPNAEDDATSAARQPVRKGASEEEGLERLSGKGERAEADKKKMNELTKNGAVGGRGALENKLADSSEALREMDGRKKAGSNVWQPVLLADENGRAVIEFTMPEAPGEYRLDLGVNGQGRFGRLLTTLRCEPLPAAPPASAPPAAKP